MHLTSLQLNNFRCFNSLTLSFEQPMVLLRGTNGSGKTSILEALHYVCYLRSFRTYSPQELVKAGSDSFFIKAALADSDEAHDVQVGFSGKKRVLKVDQKAVRSYQELLDWYRVVSLTEDDLDIIKQGPEMRRAFLDQAILLLKPSYVQHLKALRHITESRNALLKQRTHDRDSYMVWSMELWNVSRIIAEERMAFLAILEKEVCRLLEHYYPREYSLVLRYAPRKDYEQDAATLFNELMPDEQRMGRSLCGAHLDDVTILFQHQRSRQFASRGQQKLIILFMKVAQVNLLTQAGLGTVFLLDDFMTDFDERRIQVSLDALGALPSQRIFTSPLQGGTLTDQLQYRNTQVITLSSL